MIEDSERFAKIKVSGNTFPVKEILKAAGFKWDKNHWAGTLEESRLVNFKKFIHEHGLKCEINESISDDSESKEDELEEDPKVDSNKPSYPQYKEVQIYVYGSCHYSNQIINEGQIGRGGYGVVIQTKGQNTEELAGGFSNTTNARMEIIGIIEGIKKIDTPSNIIVYLNNQYIIDTLTKGWLENWKNKEFKNRKHADLWMKFDKLISNTQHIINFKHSKTLNNIKSFSDAEGLAKCMSKKDCLPNDIIITETMFKADNQTKCSDFINNEIKNPILDSICVDASTLSNPGPTEYRGVDTKTKNIIFEMKLKEATNNIGEFLAIVHALRFFKKNQKELNILYSDSLTAISWVKNKKCKTKYQITDNNSDVFELINLAETWLQSNQYKTKVLKWETDLWGEIPADYGRK